MRIMTPERQAALDAARRELIVATAAYQRAEEDIKQARARQRAAIYAAMGADMRQIEATQLTGFTREHIRRIVEEIVATSGEAPDPAGVAAALR